LDFVVKDWQWTFHADSFDYAKAPEISLRFGARPPKKGEPFPAWVNIESFRLPSSAYKMTQTENTIDLVFSEPVPVTDISFFNGNPNDADAWERKPVRKNTNWKSSVVTALGKQGKNRLGKCTLIICLRRINGKRPPGTGSSYA
jgi:hypothetical protein